MVVFQRAVYEELVNMFGIKHDSLIQKVLKVPVVYNITRDELDYYEDIYDTLTNEDQNVVDYFEDKLKDNQRYIIGSSIGVIISFIFFR